MTEEARHLAERVFPDGVRVRQWVLSLPFELRWRAAFDHELALALVRISARAIEARYRRLARRAGLRSPRAGSVCVIQRFSSDLRLNLHLHGAHLDGAYGVDRHGVRRFFTAPAPSPAEVEKILARIVRRARALLARDEPALDEEQLTLAQGCSASARGDGAKAHRPDDVPDELLGLVLLPTRRKARLDGWDLDAETAVKEHEHERLQMMFRYLLRPPIALDRLKLIGDQIVCLELKRPWSDGTSHVTMSPSVFIGRLASLVPRPRANTIIYSGVLAAHAKDRAELIAARRSKRRRHEDASWASLMRHSFGLRVLSCPRCRGRMRFVAVIFDRTEVKRLLCFLRCWSDPLPIRPARGPPEHEETLDFP